MARAAICDGAAAQIEVACLMVVIAGFKRGRDPEIANSPAGHGIGLGEAIDRDRALVHLGQRGEADVLGTVEDEALVELIRIDEEIVLARDRSDPLGGLPVWTLPVGLSGETIRMARVRG